MASPQPWGRINSGVAQRKACKVHIPGTDPDNLIYHNTSELARPSASQTISDSRTSSERRICAALTGVHTSS